MPETSRPTLPVPGVRVRMVGARTIVVVGERIGEGSQGVVHRAVLPSGAAVALKWYRETTGDDEQRRAISALIAHGRPHPSFLWPIDLVTSDQVRGFGYVMPLRDPRFVSFAQMLGHPRQPSFRVLATIGRELVDAFAALHFGGLSYRDVSFGNLFVDPEQAEVAVCDNDNVGTDSAHVAVYGTLRFMAPEIVRDEAVPSTVTDLHSLAVLLFYLFVHGHPLEGAQVLGGATSDKDDLQSDDERSVRYYGTAPLFVFDPDNDANRPLSDDPMLVWWRIYPGFLRHLFTHAFTTGLHDASLAGRLTEGVWRRALLRLCDSVSECPACRAERFFDPDDPGARCWNCGVATSVPAQLEIQRACLVLAPGAVLTEHHLRRNRAHRAVVGSVERHPERPGELVIRNRSTMPWTIRPDDEPTKVVAPGQRMHVRPMTIDFGPAVGVVRDLSSDGARTVGSPAVLPPPPDRFRPRRPTDRASEV